MDDHLPVKVGTGIGVFGAVFILLTTTLLFTVPDVLLSPPASITYMETWAGPIMSVGGFIFSIGLPLVCVGSAYYLVINDYSPQSVAIGFFVGAGVFIVSNAVSGVFVTNTFVAGSGIEQSFFGHMRNSMPDGFRLFVAGLIGIVFAFLRRHRV